MKKSFLVGIDGSPESNAATRKAMELAKAMDARLVLAHVSHHEGKEAASYAVAVSEGDMLEQDYAPALLSQAERDCRAAGVEARTSGGQGPIAETLAGIAGRENVEMVIVGHRGRGAIARAVLGSVAERLLQISHCPVLVVR
jgi:nucleotide-binding universal stress UspA family protein